MDELDYTQLADPALITDAYDRAALGGTTWIMKDGTRLAAIVPAAEAEHWGQEETTRRRARLVHDHGKPRMLHGEAIGPALAALGIENVKPDEVVAFAYRDRAAAEAWTEANRLHYGHVSLGIGEILGETVGVLDLRPWLGRHD
jgi:hypothetical protein